MPIIQHGAFTHETYFECTQHHYVGFDTEGEGPAGYATLIEVRDPPSSKRPIFIYRWEEKVGGILVEFNSVDEARDAFDLFLQERSKLVPKYCLDLKGATGYHMLTESPPWFYAKDPSEIKGHGLKPKNK